MPFCRAGYFVALLEHRRYLENLTILYNDTDNNAGRGQFPSHNKYITICHMFYRYQQDNRNDNLLRRRIIGNALRIVHIESLYVHAQSYIVYNKPIYIPFISLT